MPVRRGSGPWVAVLAIVATSAFAGGSAILAQGVEPGISPGPMGSPITMSPLPVGSLPPGSPEVSPAAESPAPMPSPAAASPGASASAATVVGVTLQEVAVIPESSEIPGGPLTVEATNVGPALAHELVVVRTDLPSDGLPTLEDGSFDESAEGVEVLGEIEPIDPGVTASLAVDLPAGHYVFLCNVVGDLEGEPFSHYAAGMRVDVEVVDAAEAGTSPGAEGSPGTVVSPGVASPAITVTPATNAPMPSEPPGSPTA